MYVLINLSAIIDATYLFKGDVCQPPVYVLVQRTEWSCSRHVSGGPHYPCPLRGKDQADHHITNTRHGIGGLCILQCSACLRAGSVRQNLALLPISTSYNTYIILYHFLFILKYFPKPPTSISLWPSLNEILRKYVACIDTWLVALNIYKRQ